MYSVAGSLPGSTSRPSTRTVGEPGNRTRSAVAYRASGLQPGRGASGQAGISTKAIRYYEQIGILTPPARTSSGYRSYDETAIGRLGFVRAAQAVGLTLGEIRQIIAFRDDGQAPAPMSPTRCGAMPLTVPA
jgi:MerR HTH family regulatory protein